MHKLAIAILIGAGAGALDIIPMLVRKAELHIMASAFTHWVVVTLFIAIAIVLGAVVGLATSRFAV